MERNKERKQAKKKELIEQLKARTPEDKSQYLNEQPDHEKDGVLLFKQQDDNRELKKKIKKLENRMNEQAQKLQTVIAKSSRLEAENKSLRTSLYEANTEWNKEKKLGLEKQAYIERLNQKCKALEQENTDKLAQVEKLKVELAKAQTLTNTNTTGHRKLRDSLNQLHKLNQELSRELQIEKEIRSDLDQLTHLKQTIRAQATYIQELKSSKSGLISEASVQELYSAMRDKLVLAKPTHKKMLLDLFNNLNSIKLRFVEASRPSNHHASSKVKYGYLIKTGEEVHFYNLENGVYRVQSGDNSYESDLPVKAEMINEHEVSIVKQYTYHYVPKASNAVRRKYKKQSTESTALPMISTGIKVLIIGSKNRSSYTRALTEYGFIIEWYDGYEESPEALKSKRDGVQVVIICTGHSPHFVLDLFQSDDPRVEKIYRENANSIYHRIRYNAIKLGLM